MASTLTTVRTRPKTTMEDLAFEAGLGKRSLYLHVASKEAVALSTIDRIVDRLTGQLREVAAAVGPPEERLREMLLRRVLVRFDSATAPGTPDCAHAEHRFAWLRVSSRPSPRQHGKTLERP